MITTNTTYPFLIQFMETGRNSTGVGGDGSLVEETGQVTKKIRQSYSNAVKMRALQLVEELRGSDKYPVVEAAARLNIKPRSLRKLMSKAASIQASEPKLKKIHLGRPRLFAAGEVVAVSYIQSRRERRLTVKPLDVAVEVTRGFPHSFPNIDACRKWVYRILGRNDLSLRRKTHDAGAMSEQEMGEIHLDFVLHIRRLIEFHEFDLKKVINMDETGCYFDMVSSTTIATRGAKTVAVEATGNPAYCTVFLAVAMNGAKLKPLVVWKAKHDGTFAKRLHTGGLDRRNAYCCQAKGWCDEPTMDHWVQECLEPYLAGNAGAMLMMANFSVHQTAATRDRIYRLGCSIAMLPPNMTSRVQILDVGINKPFKDSMRTYYHQYLLSATAGEKAKVTRQLMSQWIADSWELLPARFITNTCRKIGLLNCIIERQCKAPGHNFRSSFYALTRYRTAKPAPLPQRPARRGCSHTWPGKLEKPFLRNSLRFGRSKGTL